MGKAQSTEKSHLSHDFMVPIPGYQRNPKLRLTVASLHSKSIISKVMLLPYIILRYEKHLDRKWRKKVKSD